MTTSDAEAIRRARDKLSGTVRDRPQVDAWHVWTVVGVNGDGTCDISRLGSIDDHVSCLNGFVPTINDLVWVQTNNEIGSIVHGRIPRRSASDA